MVGAHIHILLLLDTALLLCFVTDIDRRGEAGRSIENLTDDDDDDGDEGDERRPDRLKRVGEEERVKKGDDREAKLEDADANADEEGRDIVLFLEGGEDMQAEEAIVEAVERERVCK